MKKFFAHVTKEEWKDEIIVYAKSKGEAYRLVEDNLSEIECDYGSEYIKIFNWPPKEKFDKDDIYIIKRDEIIEPKLKIMRTFSGDIFHRLWPDERDSELAYLQEKDTQSLRKQIYNLISRQIKVAKIKSLNKQKALYEKNLD